LQALAVETIQPLGQHLVDEQLLAAEVVVDRGKVGIRATGDLAQRHGLIAALDEQPFRGLQQAFARAGVTDAGVLAIHSA
jgi:hypothetical protein